MADVDFIDTHYHAGADVYQRRHSVWQAGERYAEHRGWVVVKSHLGATAATAWEARQAGLPVSGALTLNAISGGLDVRVIEQAVYQHGDDSPLRLMVHLPTLTDHHPSALRHTPFYPDLHEERLVRLRVSDDDGQLRPEVAEIIRAARDLPVVLATGHANRDEVYRLIDLARTLGLDRLLLTHPSHPMTGLSADELAALSDTTEVYVELTALTRLLGQHDGPTFSSVLRCNPRVVYSSDLGQLDRPDVADWLTLSQDWFAEAGLTDADIARVTHDAARELTAL